MAQEVNYFILTGSGNEKEFVLQIDGKNFLCSREITAGDTYYYHQSDGSFREIISKNGFFDGNGKPFQLPHCFKKVREI